jgi:hypothetical protein
MQYPGQGVRGWLHAVLRGWFARIHGINQKYATPRIHMSPGVRFALLFLRLYLVFLVLLLAYKFWTLVR